MTTTHLELETTFDVPEGTELPDLTGVHGVAAVEQVPPVRLVADYHDTADLRLLRNGITLRRRTGGSDAGWHLKLPAGRAPGGGRLEVHARPGRPVTRVPADLLSLVRAVTRRDEVAPVARLSTRRAVERLLGADGTVLAELAVDRVEAEVPPAPGAGPAATTSRKVWDEVEVELVDGDDALLAAVTAAFRDAGVRVADSQSKIARALGDRLVPLPRSSPQAAHAPAKKGKAPRPTAGDVAVEYCNAQVAAILRLDPYVRLDTEDAVHAMRVASRRLRSALATFRPVLDREAVQVLRDELRWLGQVLGPARDLEVLCDRLLKRLATLDPALVRDGTAERIRADLGERRDAVMATARAEMESSRYLDLLDRLDGFVLRPPLTAKAGKRPEAVLAPRLRAEVARVLAAAATAETGRADERDAALHEVRKAAKRARYAAEATAAVLGRPAVKVGGYAKKLQEVLGVRQDAAVTREVIGEVALREFARGTDTFTMGVLAGIDAAAADEHDHELLLDKLRSARRRLP